MSRRMENTETENIYVFIVWNLKPIKSRAIQKRLYTLDNLIEYAIEP